MYEVHWDDCWTGRAIPRIMPFNDVVEMANFICRLAIAKEDNENIQVIRK